jgi:hypothetical protein
MSVRVYERTCNPSHHWPSLIIHNPDAGMAHSPDSSILLGLDAKPESRELLCLSYLTTIQLCGRAEVQKTVIVSENSY